MRYAVAWATPVSRSEINAWAERHPDHITLKVWQQLAFPWAKPARHHEDDFLVGLTVVSDADITYQLSGETANWLATSSQRAREAWEQKAATLHKRFGSSEDEQFQLEAAAHDLREVVEKSGPQFKLYKVVGRG